MRPLQAVRWQSASRRRAGFAQIRAARLLVADLEQRAQEVQPFDRVVEFEAVLLVSGRDRQDLREAPSLAATAYGTLFVPLQRSACDWTQVSLLLLPVMAFGADAPHRPTQKVVWLIGFADGRRKVKDALCYSVFKERAEAIEKAPSLFQPKKQGGYNQVF